MIKPNQLSKCHNAPVVVCEGDAWDVKTVRRGSTYYYGCTECKEACDVAPSSDTPEREKLCDCGTMKSSHKKMYHEKQQTFGEPSSDTNELRQQIGNAMQCDDAEHLKDDTGEACYQCQIDKVMELIATKEQQARIDEEINTLEWVLNQLCFDGGEQDVKYITDRLKELKGDI